MTTLTITREKDQLAMLCIGLGGCYADSLRGSHITYYDTRIERYYHELAEGGFVVIKTELLDRSPSLAFAAPMCHGPWLGQERHQVPGFDADNFLLGVFAQHSEGGFGPLARMASTTETAENRAKRGPSNPGPFDDVSPALFAKWWLDRGAKVGVRRGDCIVWSDGTSENISAA